MNKTTLPAMPRILVAVFTALTTVFLVSCEMLDTPPTSEEPIFPGRPYPDACSDSRSALELAEASEKERGLACLIKNHRDQGRSEMHYHPILGEVARMRAQDMAEYGYYGGADYGLPYPPHVDRHGYGPNHYMCEAGYIPQHEWYCTGDNPYRNTIESISWGSGSSRISVYEQLSSWLRSPGHRRQVLAESPDEVESINYGVGHAATADSPDVEDGGANYWVFIAAPPPQSKEAIAVQKY